MVPCNHVPVLFDVIKGKSKNTVQFFQKFGPFVTVQGQNYLTIRESKKFVTLLISIPDRLMIIYLAVHGQYKISVLAE